MGGAGRVTNKMAHGCPVSPDSTRRGVHATLGDGADGPNRHDMGARADAMLRGIKCPTGANIRGMAAAMGATKRTVTIVIQHMINVMRKTYIILKPFHGAYRGCD